MATIKDVGKVAEDLEQLVKELRDELESGLDFEKLVQIADEISEHADNAAATFSSVNDVLMSRIDELSGKGRSGQKSSSGGSQSREKSQATTSS
jgi:hypothetical protein